MDRAKGGWGSLESSIHAGVDRRCPLSLVDAQAPGTLLKLPLGLSNVTQARLWRWGHWDIYPQDSGRSQTQMWMETAERGR
jgi:hypothetical protein